MLMEKIKKAILNKSTSYNQYKQGYEELLQQQHLKDEQIESYKNYIQKRQNLSWNNNKQKAHEFHQQKYRQSRFYEIEKKRFSAKDDSVKWELDDKVNAYSFVEKYNITHPETIAKFTDITQLKEYHHNGKLPEKFVLKISNRHSCIGVMLLRQIDENSYFDDLSAKTYTIDEIIVQQQRIDSTKGHVLRDTYFIIEELVANFVKEYKIPYDYKVFCLHGIPKLILQVDRNVYHNTMTFFDGNFIPLKEGIDWFINNDMAQQCIPVIPPSASQILTLSRRWKWMLMKNW